MRGIFFDDETAEAVAAELVRAGWTARVEIERLAGEDDDEDHQWAVLSDAPYVQFEVVVDAHDGWLDTDDDAGAPATPPPPLDLPDAPKRIKRPQ